LERSLPHHGLPIKQPIGRAVSKQGMGIMLVGSHGLGSLSHQHVEDMVVVKFVALLLNKAQHLEQRPLGIEIGSGGATVVTHAVAVVLVKAFAEVMENLLATADRRLGIIDDLLQDLRADLPLGYGLVLHEFGQLF